MIPRVAISVPERLWTHTADRGVFGLLRAKGPVDIVASPNRDQGEGRIPDR